jgi:hypothetical protein
MPPHLDALFLIRIVIITIAKFYDELARNLFGLVDVDVVNG